MSFPVWWPLHGCIFYTYTTARLLYFTTTLPYVMFAEVKTPPAPVLHIINWTNGNEWNGNLNQNAIFFFLTDRKWKILSPNGGHLYPNVWTTQTRYNLIFKEMCLEKIRYLFMVSLKRAPYRGLSRALMLPIISRSCCHGLSINISYIA